ncbi:MAG: BlaI/MecI/CopY family transcriptional regulator [Cytophagales bacterium]|nr:MAG: BlaI/MecI/CopY family transcriptional regulator [Cytophagales bacterium]TAF60316.1 MAG: BlaI/MecI/CopY family transcriptional regulator [Cytophagales bacterium]
MKRLTKAEEEIMQILWALDEAYVRDLIEQIPAPKPAYTTVSTVIRVLETKGFVAHKTLGNTHLYYPLISKDDYARQSVKGLLSDYFGGSFAKLASFFAEDTDVDMKDLEKMLKVIDDKLSTDKSDS